MTVCRVSCLLLALTVAVCSAGCCASPYRFWQNAYGWNDVHPDNYHKGDGNPPKTTPPGPTSPSITKQNSSVY